MHRPNVQASSEQICFWFISTTPLQTDLPYKVTHEVSTLFLREFHFCRIFVSTSENARFEPRKKKRGPFLSELNPGCLIGILISWFIKSSPHNWVVNFIPNLYPKEQPQYSRFFSLLICTNPLVWMPNPPVWDAMCAMVKKSLYWRWPSHL